MYSKQNLLTVLSFVTSGRDFLYYYYRNTVLLNALRFVTWGNIFMVKLVIFFFFFSPLKLYNLNSCLFGKIVNYCTSVIMWSAEGKIPAEKVPFP